jgi:O-antigen ligase
MFRSFCRKEDDMFATNVGGLDRMLRIAVRAALIVATLAGGVGLWGWLGVVPLATGLMRSCPLYSLLGVRTCAAPKGA